MATDQQEVVKHAGETSVQRAQHGGEYLAAAWHTGHIPAAWQPHSSHVLRMFRRLVVPLSVAERNRKALNDGHVHRAAAWAVSECVYARIWGQEQSADTAAVNCFLNRQHNGRQIVSEFKGAAYYSWLRIIPKYERKNLCEWGEGDNKGDAADEEEEDPLAELSFYYIRSPPWTPPLLQPQRRLHVWSSRLLGDTNTNPSLWDVGCCAPKPHFFIPVSHHSKRSRLL